MCDSSIPGRNDGRLDDETFAWLEGVLADARDEPVFICFHHPPVPVHSPFLDSIRQRDEERLAALVRRSPQVVALLCGHAHTPCAATFGGRPLLVAPGVVSTLRFPWEGTEPLDYSLPPAFAYHILDDERHLVTHFRVVPLPE
jgi:Icc protein